MILKKRIRVMKKIQQDGVWKFITIARDGSRLVWDDRPGMYYLEWWDGSQRRREVAGQTPSQVVAAQRRKQAELIGAQVLNGHQPPHVSKRRPVQAVEEPEEDEEDNEDDTQTPLIEARKLFSAHIAAHSPDKPETQRRYGQVMEHFERLFGHRQFAEAITRADIDEYKITRRQEKSERTERLISARTVNFEVGVLRTFFYYLINERGLDIDNPCAKFKKLRDAKQRSGSRPPTYNQAELDALFAHSDAFEGAVFGTLLLTGLRKRELYFLTWPDIDFRGDVLRVSADGKEGFSPKDYEIREIPMPADLVEILKAQPRRSQWVFPNRNGRRLSHLLRRLKTTADRAGVANATLHKFRHTYCTRLLETGTDIVTVQKLMGHSDIETTMRYLNPRDELKHSAAKRLSLRTSDADIPRKGAGAERAKIDHDAVASG